MVSDCFISDQSMPMQPVLLQFNAERMDSICDAYHSGNGYRSYYPHLCRFGCPDSYSPFGAGGINAYAWCAGDPVNHSDPSGHMSCQGIIGMVMGITGIALIPLTLGQSLTVMTCLTIGLDTVSALSGMGSAILEKASPKTSEILGWVSLATGAAAIGSGLIAKGASMTGAMRSLGQRANSYRALESMAHEAPLIERPEEMLSLFSGHPETQQPGHSATQLTANLGASTTLTDLPEEMIREIGNYLEREHLGNFRLTHSRIAGALPENYLMMRGIRKENVAGYQYVEKWEEARYASQYESKEQGLIKQLFRQEDYYRMNVARQRQETRQIGFILERKKLAASFRNIDNYSQWSHLTGYDIIDYHLSGFS